MSFEPAGTDTDAGSSSGSPTTSTTTDSSAGPSSSSTTTDDHETGSPGDVCRSDDECTDTVDKFCIEGSCVSCLSLDDPHGGCADLDPAAPLCIAGTCLSCADTDAPDRACAEVDEGLPVCFEGKCSQCNEADATLCSDEAPICFMGECSPCTYHFQCPESACNLWTGKCMDAAPATIGLAAHHDFPSLTAAVQTVQAGQEAVFIMHGNSNGAPFIEDVELSGDRVVALLGATVPPILQGPGDHHLIRVDNGATLMVEGVRFTGYQPFTTLYPLRVDGARLALDRTEVVDNRLGVILLNGSQGRLRNTTIGVTAPAPRPALAVTSSDVELLYTTLVATATNVGINESTRPAGLYCDGAGVRRVRNSIIVNVHDETPSINGCDDADITYTATTESVPGEGNTVVGSFDDRWFSDWPLDMRLSTGGGVQFANVAKWLIGDPPTDIDDTARPTVDGASDHAGAHKP